MMQQLNSYKKDQIGEADHESAPAPPGSEYLEETFKENTIGIIKGQVRVKDNLVHPQAFKKSFWSCKSASRFKLNLFSQDCLLLYFEIDISTAKSGLVHQCFGKLNGFLA